MKENRGVNLALHIFFIVLCVLCVFPVLLTLSISFTDESMLFEKGYQLIPSKFTLDAYKWVFSSTGSILRAYANTIWVTFAGTIFGVAVTALYAYVISRPDFKYRNAFSFFSYFTMLFNGGLVASYLINTRMLGLGNSMAALIIPGTLSAWNVMVMRAFFDTSVPISIIESGKLDGASELRIFAKLVVPIAKPGIMTIALFLVLNKWNDWSTPMLYITDREKYTLAFLMQNMLTNIQEMVSASQHAGVTLDMGEVPHAGSRQPT